MLISNKVWEMRQQNGSDIDLVGSIAKEFNISDITAKILLNRGLNKTEEISKFLAPSINHFHNPFLLKDMDKAVSRIISAIENKERIIVYGDYDVDGITSTSILLCYLREFTDNIDFYIPDRIEEGYGLSVSSIDKVISNGANLIITVDCGITAVEEVEYIKKCNTEIIITDHHECKDIIPNALAVINPKQKECKYPFKELAGVGVAFKLIQALAEKMKVDNVIDKYIEIVALGTVADVVPLLDENRVIVKFGLEKLQNTDKVGIKSLINISGLHGKPISTTSIGYILAPRINAAGRIGNARRGVELFTNKDKEQADQIALELDQENRNRQHTENIILNEALEMVLNDPEYNRRKVIVLAGEGWHYGVIGIVASRITEKFNKPTILISLDGENGKGSGRSIPGFNVFEALMNCSSFLEKFGGHELAVGLSIKRENILRFIETINSFADSVLCEDDFYPRVKIDTEILKQNIKFELLRELKMLEPYGVGNPYPIFLYNDLKIVDYRTVGDDKHIKLRVEDDDLYVDSIGFNLGELAPKIDVLDKVDIVCSIESNVWNGQEKIQLNIKDIRTNHEILFKEKYYSTLEKSIFNSIKVQNTDKDILSKIVIINDNIPNLVKNNQKNVILINTLKGAKNFIDILKRMLTHEKNVFKVYYNNSSGDNNIKNIAIINPHFENIDFSQFDNVIMYDLCFTRNQYIYLTNNSKNVYLMNGLDNHVNNIDVFECIIPQRDDFIKVYQYIKSRNWGQLVEGDIFSLTREIAVSYNIDINSLKLKKIFEIFEEMNLISLDIQDGHYKIQINKQKQAKVDIKMSKGLLDLLKVKDEFNYFVDYLKHREIS